VICVNFEIEWRPHRQKARSLYSRDGAGVSKIQTVQMGSKFQRWRRNGMDEDKEGRWSGSCIQHTLQSSRCKGEVLDTLKVKCSLVFTPVSLLHILNI
jgi:hypothetical protein